MKKDYLSWGLGMTNPKDMLMDHILPRVHFDGDQCCNDCSYYNEMTVVCDLFCTSLHSYKKKKNNTKLRCIPCLNTFGDREAKD